MMKDVLGQSFAYGAATIASRGTLVVSLLILPYILSPTDYGVLAMITLTGVLVGHVVPLQVTQGLARYYSPAAEPDRTEYASTAWLFSLGSFAIFLILSQIAAPWICELLLGDRKYLPALRISFLVMSLNNLFYFLQVQFRYEFRVSGFVVVSLVYSLLTLLLSISLGALFSKAIEGVVTGQLIGAAASVALGLWMLRRSLFASVNVNKLREMLQFSLPLVPASVAMFLMVYAGRLSLNDLGTLGDVGIYSFATQIAGVATLAILGVQAALTPLVMAHHHEPDTPAAIGRFFEAFSVVGVCLCLAIGLFTPELLSWLGNPAYAGASELVIILAPALIILELYIFSPGFLVAKKTSWQMWVTIASAGVAVVSSYVLVGLWGAYGAAFAALLSAIFFFGSWFYLGHRLYPVPVRWRAVGAVCIAGIAAGATGMSLEMNSIALSLLLKAGILTAVMLLIVRTRLFPFAELFRRVLQLRPGNS
jgi:O-antigen/teichoic acid export membrane protein